MRQPRELSELRNPLNSTSPCTIMIDTNESKNQLPHIAITVPPRVIPTLISGYYRLARCYYEERQHAIAPTKAC